MAYIHTLDPDDRINATHINLFTRLPALPLPDLSPIGSNPTPLPPPPAHAVSPRKSSVVAAPPGMVLRGRPRTCVFGERAYLESRARLGPDVPEWSHCCQRGRFEPGFSHRW